MREPINITFAADDNYAQHVAVSMAAILLHMQEPERAHFFLLADGVSEEKQEKLRMTVKNLGGSLQIVPILSDKYADLYVSGQLSRTAYARLDLAELLVGIEKVIYLDCDLMVHVDIAELWDTDLEGFPMGAVPDLGIMSSKRRWSEKKSLMALNDDMNYFNSGVLLIDLKAWREHGYGLQAAGLARAHSYPHHDQDALNKVFLRKWKALPLRWNVIPPVFNMFIKVLLKGRFRREAARAVRNPAIIHYAGGYKPWEYERHDDFNGAYYDALQATAFGDAKMPQMDPRRRNRSLTRQLWRLRWGHFWGQVLSAEEMK